MENLELDLGKRFGGRQMKLASTLLGQDEAASEDACHEARQNVARHIMTSNKPIRSQWLYLRKATVNACYKELRRRYRERGRLASAADRYFIAEARDPVMAAMLADVLLTSDQIVRAHFGSQDVAIFRFRYYEGLTLREIAERLGLSLSTVKKHHRAIVAKLRATLVVE